MTGRKNITQDWKLHIYQNRCHWYPILYPNVLNGNVFCALCFLLNFSKLQTYIHILEIVLNEVKLNIYHVDITSRNVTENYAG